MRLLYIHDVLVPSLAANSVQVAKMCRAFAANGAEVTLAVPSQNWSATEHYLRVAEAYGFGENFFDVLPVRQFKGRGQDLLFSFLALLKAIPWKPDVIFSRSPTISLMTARLGFRTVFELHDPPTELGRKRFRRLKKLVNERNLICFVVTSRRLQEVSRACFPQIARKILTAPNGADAPTEQIQGTLELAGQFKVVYTGHLYKGKGMEIISALAPSCPWATFHVVGGSSDDVHFWSKKLAGHANVQFHGHVPHARTSLYMASADVLIAPYLREVHGSGGGGNNIAEGMSPLKLFEYMAHEKPILTTNLPAIREILEDQESALLVSPDNVEEWVAALNYLRFDKSLRNRLSSRAKHDFDARFSRDARAKLILGRILNG